MLCQVPSIWKGKFLVLWTWSELFGKSWGWWGDHHLVLMFLMMNPWLIFGVTTMKPWCSLWCCFLLWWQKFSWWPCTNSITPTWPPFTAITYFIVSHLSTETGDQEKADVLPRVLEKEKSCTFSGYKLSSFICTLSPKKHQLTEK